MEGIRCCEAVHKRLQEGHDLVLLLTRQAEIADRHVDVVRDLGSRPAVHLVRRCRRAVPRRDVVRKHVACIVEMDELLQAFDVAVMKELLLEVRPGRLGREKLASP